MHPPATTETSRSPVSERGARGTVTFIDARYKPTLWTRAGAALLEKSSPCSERNGEASSTRTNASFGAGRGRARGGGCVDHPIQRTSHHQRCPHPEERETRGFARLVRLP